MPTDKALAVMTLQHHAGIARLAGNEEVNESEGYHPYGVSAKHLRDIESVVRHLVDHPERLAGEDEVVVRREEIEAVRLAASRLTEEAQDVDDEINALNILAITKRWLAGSPTAQESTNG